MKILIFVIFLSLAGLISTNGPSSGIGNLEECQKGLEESTKTLVEKCNSKEIPAGAMPFSQEELKPFFEESGLKIAQECTGGENGIPDDCSKLTKISQCLNEKNICSHIKKFEISV
uniref:10 kDa family memberl n=1 Tax=Nyssomyia intermedia TaxID=182990 RepID=J7HII2_9DIPT